jgi:uncharacterized protein
MLRLPAGHNVEEGFLPTCTGRRVHIASPLPDEIDIEDIAHGLSHACRFAGHVQNFYSVAQHSLLVSELVDDRHALWGLLHDGSEAYLHDLTRPLKRIIATLPETADRLRYVGDSLAHDLVDQGLVTKETWMIVSNVITTAIVEDRLRRGVDYAELERRMMAAICGRFGLPAAMPAEVAAADNVVLATEFRDVCHHPPEICAAWSGAQPMARYIKPLCPEVARDLFLVRFEKLAAKVV